MDKNIPSSKQEVTTIICDFDNTLFNWFEQWYNSFTKLLNRLESLGFEREQLVADIQIVNRTHGTSEYHNLLDELSLLNSLGENKDKLINELKAYYLEQKHANLSLYPTVLETLLALKEVGCKIIIYTESQALYSNERLMQLELDGIVDLIYSPVHQVEVESKNYKGIHTLNSTQHISLPKHDIKPNPKVLSDIISQAGACSSKVIYIGDSKMKDIQMANQAEITSIWAKYGCNISNEEYALLKQVSHWTDEDIAKEEEIKRKSIGELLIPDYTLHTSFEEVLDLFVFKKF